MSGYDFTSIEAKWQTFWGDHDTFVQPNPGQPGFEDNPPFYVLDMFPYPSGSGLHVGHPEGYTATDIIARYKRMKGFNVLHPMGYDSFGLPAEQYAVTHGVHPRATTEKNIENIERQIKSFGFSYDWSRRIATTDTEYYRWTQWIFLNLFESYFDPIEQRAEPIRELINKLEAGEYFLNLDGSLAVPTGLDTIADAFMFQSELHVRFEELSDEEKHAVIDQHRLAYQAEVPVNWCPQLGTVLANEEVTNEGRSDRGNYPVFRRNLKQWMLRITAYAERLLADIDDVNWPEPIKLMQRNWIGKSIGAEVDFALDDESGEVIRVFTTRPDTLFGATYMVLAPEHPLVTDITTSQQKVAVQAYIETTAKKSELERTAETKDKTGVATGAFAINPVNGEQIPIWVADYVMMGYGTGAIMAVPGHDTRDFEFATAYQLPILQVVEPPAGHDWQGYTGDGVAVNSSQFDGLSTKEFKKQIIEWLEDRSAGTGAINYKLRDWLFSRQRYWGEPFPIVHCDTCGVVGLPETELPVLLPPMDDFSPASSDDPNAPPKPPLGKMTDWIQTPCPICGQMAQRELNTMPQWAGSCWYYLRYLDPKNDTQFVDPEIEKYWMGDKGVGLYVGGAEHAVLHLLYSRFWHKVLFDLRLVGSKEPFGTLFNQGMIRAFAYRDARGVAVPSDQVDLSGETPVSKKTGDPLTAAVEKMSKSIGNVVNPDEIIAQYGADTFRLYEMFMGPLEASKPWNTNDVPGVHRFCHRVWRMICGDSENNVTPLLSDNSDDAVEQELHRLIKKVGEDIDAMKFNTAISAMMEFVNAVFRRGAISHVQAERFVLVLAPFTPHLAEELWAVLGHASSLSHEPFPVYSEELLEDDEIELPVQILGKVKSRITVAADANQKTIIAAAMADEKIAALLEGKTVVKTIVVPGRMVNIVAK